MARSPFPQTSAHWLTDRYRRTCFAPSSYRFMSTHTVVALRSRIVAGDSLKCSMHFCDLSKIVLSASWFDRYYKVSKYLVVMRNYIFYLKLIFECIQKQFIGTVSKQFFQLRTITSYQNPKAIYGGKFTCDIELLADHD